MMTTSKVVKRIKILSLVVAMSLAAVEYAEAGTYKKAGKARIQNSYIVTLKPDITNVKGTAAALQHAFGGRIMGTMEHAMKGFGFNGTEQQARALSHHPSVAMVEEDEQMELAASARFNFAEAGGKPKQQAFANYCPWTGSYYACTYADPNVNRFWHLDRLDNQGYINGVNRAYAYVSTGANVRIYVVDSGVYLHDELYGRVEVGANMTMDPDMADGREQTEEEYPHNTDSSPAWNPCGGWRTSPIDNAGHGTAVASVAAGTNTGVAKNATIVPVKVRTCDGGWMAKLVVARGLDWIQLDNQSRLDGKRAVVNMSIFVDPGSLQFPSVPVTQGQNTCEDGSGGYTNCISAIESEINELIRPDVANGRYGIPVVVSANNQGNDSCTTTPARMGEAAQNTTYSYPTTYRTITVGGTMSFSQNAYADRRWECNSTPEGCDAINFPSEIGSNYGGCVSIYAPAWNVRTAAANGPSSYRPDGAASSGTSFAAPIVTGIVARLLERYPTMTSVEVWDALKTRAGYRWTTDSLDPNNGNRRLVYMSPTE